MKVDETGAGFQARVLVPFRGCDDGAAYPRQISPGDVIRGDLAQVAVREGWAKAIAGAPENKAVEAAYDGPFLTGAGASSSSAPLDPAKGKRTSRQRVTKRS